MDLAEPSENSTNAALAGYNNSHLFLTGGSNSAAVSVYDVEANIWKSCPPLKQNRSYHSSCVVGDYLYVVGGKDSENGTTITTIERASCIGLIQYTGEQLGEDQNNDAPVTRLTQDFEMIEREDSPDQ